MSAMPTKKKATPHRVAVVQHPPVTLHRRETLERGVRLIEEAATKGARLISFPETWVPGYPEWLWRLQPRHALQHGRLDRTGWRGAEPPPQARAYECGADGVGDGRRERPACQRDP